MSGNRAVSDGAAVIQIQHGAQSRFTQLIWVGEYCGKRGSCLCPGWRVVKSENGKIPSGHKPAPIHLLVQAECGIIIDTKDRFQIRILIQKGAKNFFTV